MSITFLINSIFYTPKQDYKFWRHPKQSLNLKKLYLFDNDATIKGDLWKFSKKQNSLIKCNCFLQGKQFGYTHNQSMIKIPDYKEDNNQFKKIVYTIVSNTTLILNCKDIDTNNKALNLQQFDKSKLQYHFTLIKGNHKKTFYSDDKKQIQKWINELRSLCILRDINQDYYFINEIGHGNSSKVFRLKSKIDGRIVAGKVISKSYILQSNKYLNTLINEVTITRTLNHPYIIKINEVYEDENKVYIITDYLEGGDLFKYVLENGALSEEKACIVIYRLLECLVYFKRYKIMHRDIKLENLLLENINNPKSIKLGDFGFVTKLNTEMAQLKCGSPGYMAPEVIKGKKYDWKVDIFSVGIVMYTILSGTNPFSSSNPNELLKKNKKCAINFPESRWKRISTEAKNLIISMTSIDPSARPTPEEALNSLWIRHYTKDLKKLFTLSNFNPEDIDELFDNSDLEDEDSDGEMKMKSIEHFSFMSADNVQVVQVRKKLNFQHPKTMIRLQHNQREEEDHNNTLVDDKYVEEKTILRKQTSNIRRRRHAIIAETLFNPIHMSNFNSSVYFKEKKDTAIIKNLIEKGYQQNEENVETLNTSDEENTAKFACNQIKQIYQLQFKNVFGNNKIDDFLN